MSFKAVDTALDYSEAEGSDRLVLVVIAEAANQEGHEAWPAIDTIARRSRVSRRTVFRSIKHLEEMGEIEVDYKAGKNGTNRYSLAPLMERARQLRLEEDRATGDTVPSRHRDAEGRGTVPSATPDRATGVTRTIGTTQEPSGEPSSSLRSEDPDPAVKAFCQFLATHATLASGGVERRVLSNWYEPAQDLLQRVPKPELKAVIEWAHTRPYWVTRIRTMPMLRKEWPRVRAEWAAAQQRPKTKHDEQTERNARRRALFGEAG